MLPIKSKYKVAKRLGANIFEKTQTQKFALSEARAKKAKRGGRGGSDFNRQLLEKQRVRFTYGLKEKELYNYAKRAYTEKDPSQSLHSMLEMRADSVAYRAGLASTRRAARQMVSHGHVKINGTRITTPSYRLKKGDVLEIREGSKKSPLFGRFTEAEAEKVGQNTPSWLAFDPSLLKVTIAGEPMYGITETTLDYPVVFEFYSR